MTPRTSKPKETIRNALGAVSPLPISATDLATLVGSSPMDVKGGVALDTKRHTAFVAVPEGDSLFDFAVRQHEAAHLYVAKRVGVRKYNAYFKWMLKNYDNLTAQIVMDIICNKFVPQSALAELIKHDTIIHGQINDHRIGYPLARAFASGVVKHDYGIFKDRCEPPISAGWIWAISETAKKLASTNFGTPTQRRYVDELYRLCNPSTKEESTAFSDPKPRTTGKSLWPDPRHLRFEEGKLTTKTSPVAHETIPAYSGQFRYATRYYTDARMWQRRVEVTGDPNLTFVVDYSGSMHIGPEDIEQMLEHVHGEVWAYAGNTARRLMGRGYLTDRPIERWSSANDMDLPALQYVRRRNPHHKIVFISDMLVGGYGGTGLTTAHFTEVDNFCRQNDISIYPTISAALEDYGT